MTLIATIVGVFLAMGLSQSVEQKRKEERVSKLLETAIQDLYNTEIALSLLKVALYFDSSQVDQDTLPPALTSGTLYFPTIATQVLHSEMVLETISPHSFAFASMDLQIFENDFASIDGVRIQRSILAESLGRVTRMSVVLQKGLVSELLFLCGELDDCEVVEAWNCFEGYYGNDSGNPVNCLLEPLKRALVEKKLQEITKRKLTPKLLH